MVEEWYSITARRSPKDSFAQLLAGSVDLRIQIRDVRSHVGAQRMNFGSQFQFRLVYLRVQPRDIAPQLAKQLDHHISRFLGHRSIPFKASGLRGHYS